MNLPIPPAEDKNFGKVLAVKQAMAQSIFTTTARVRDSLLRPNEDDGFEAVKEALRRAENDDREPEEKIDVFS